MDELLAAAITIWRSPEFKRVVDIFVWLGAVNGGFWILARVMGAFVDVFSELFLEELWSVVAILYNIALAVFFAAILFVSATKGAPPSDVLWRECCGFVMLYLALSASYMDGKTHRIIDDARPGFALGLVAYIIFAAFPKIVAYPQFYTLIDLMKKLSDSWLGQLMTALVAFGIIWRMVTHGLREMFQVLSPFLWFVGALKHPPIRVRRE